MQVLLKILQCIGCANVFFVALNSSYQFSSDYFSNATLIKVLLVLVVLSFSKEIFNLIGTATTESKPLYYLFRFVTILIPGILSSFVLLIPKLLFIESRHLDSMMVKFTVKITRLWDKSELSIYLANLVEERGISKLISETDRDHIVEISNSMGELRNSLNMLVNERLESMKSEMPDRAVEIQTVVQGPSWLSENTVLVVAISVIAVVALAGIGYLLYTSSLSSRNTETTTVPIDDSNLRDIETKIGELEALVESNSTADMTAIDKLIEEKVSAESEDINAHLYRLDRLAQKATNDTQHVTNLTNSVSGLIKSSNEATSGLNTLGRQMQNVKSDLKGFRANLLDTSHTAEEALKRVTKLIDEQPVGKIASETNAVPKEIIDQLEVLSKKVSRESIASRETARSFNGRIETLEDSKSKMLESTASFAKKMVALAKEEILTSNEFVAMGILLRNETIREMLVEVETKDLIDEIAKGKKG